MITKCPKCGKKGVSIQNITVKSILKNNLRGKIGDIDYHLCVDKKCDVSYYNKDQYFSKDDTKRPIWYKEGANPKMLCYCNNVTEEDAMKVVLDEGITYLSDVLKFVTGKPPKSHCKHLNPTGKCCTQAFKNLKDNVVAIKNGEGYNEPEYHA